MAFKIWTTVIVVVVLACRTAPIGSPVEIAVPRDLSSQEVELAIVAMFTAASDRKAEGTEAERIDMLVVTDPFGAILLQQFRDTYVKSKGWFIESWQPGKIQSGFQARSHYLSVLIETERDPILISIVGSRNLKQSEKRIHKRTRVWLSSLEVDIRDALGKAQIAKRMASKAP